MIRDSNLKQSSIQKCIRYNLEVYDTNSTDIHSGFRWVRQEKTSHPKKADIQGAISKGVLVFDFRKELDRSKATEHVIMCNTKSQPDNFELHYITHGMVNQTSFDIDCHRARCG